MIEPLRSLLSTEKNNDFLSVGYTLIPAGKNELESLG